MASRTLSILTVIVLSWSLTTESADAQSAFPFRTTASLGPHGAEAQVTVAVVEGDTVFSLAVGRNSAEARLRGVTNAATAESIVSSAGRVVLVRARGEVQLAALFLLVGPRPVVAWSGRMDLHGDAGERWADAIELTDRTSDGVIDVVVGVTREGLTRCDTSAPTLLSPRALTSRGELRSVELRRGLWPTGPDGLVLGSMIPNIVPPGSIAEPVVRALRFVGASSTRGSDDVLSASPPRALTDADVGTAWAEGRPGDGTGEILVARWEAEVPISGLRFRGGAGVALPRRVSLFLGDGWANPIELVADTEDQFLRLPTPVRASCISVVIDQGAEGPLPTGFGEISAYTVYDEGNGLDALVDELVAEGEHGDDVATWMSRLGDPACVALDAAWDRLSMLGRLRAMRVAGAVRSEAGANLLFRGAGDASEEVRQEALHRMIARDAYEPLARRAVIADTAGDDAALALASDEGATLTDPSGLFEALTEGRGRAALRLAAGRIGGGNPDAVRAFARIGPPSGLAALALGLVDDRLGARGREARLALASEVIEAALTATDFEDRYRVALAARAASRTPATDAWLATQATSAEEWMQRAAALSASAPEVSSEVLSHALADPYPRVRIAAVEVAAAREDRRSVSAALQDGWPNVRATAVRALHDAPASIAALSDDVALVRVSAIEVLAELGDRSAYPSIEERLGDRDEWPEVVSAALRYIQSLCIAEAGPALAQVVRRGAREGAWAPDVELAIEAIGVAFRLGGDAATRAREAALSGGASVAAFEPALSREASFERCTP